MTDLLWTPLDISILQYVSLKGRAFTVEQLAQMFFDDDVNKAEHHLEVHCELNLLERAHRFAHPFVQLNPPKYHWRPGDPHPSDKQIAEIAERVQSRWTEAEVPVDVYFPTPVTCNLLGAYMSEPPTQESLTHELHVSETIVDLARHNPPELMRAVIGEAALPKLGLFNGPEGGIHGFKDLDLYVLDAHGQAECIYEFAGRYSEDHISAVHQHCSGGAHKKLKERYPARQHRLFPSPAGTEYYLL